MNTRYRILLAAALLMTLAACSPKAEDQVAEDQVAEDQVADREVKQDWRSDRQALGEATYASACA
jgi:hypothetical protein